VCARARHCQVPKQPNFYDCGVYVVEAAARFLILLGDPLVGVTHEMLRNDCQKDARGGALFTPTWFKKADIAQRRRLLKLTVEALHEEPAHHLALHLSGGAQLAEESDEEDMCEIMSDTEAAKRMSLAAVVEPAAGGAAAAAGGAAAAPRRRGGAAGASVPAAAGDGSGDAAAASVVAGDAGSGVAAAAAGSAGSDAADADAAAGASARDALAALAAAAAAAAGDGVIDCVMEEDGGAAVAAPAAAAAAEVDVSMAGADDGGDSDATEEDPNRGWRRRSV
jgi:hypothetical protein